MPDRVEGEAAGDVRGNGWAASAAGPLAGDRQWHPENTVRPGPAPLAGGWGPGGARGEEKGPEGGEVVGRGRVWAVGGEVGVPGG